MSKLIAPLAVFGAVLVAMVALNNGATSPPALSAGGDARAAAARADRLLTRARESGDAALYARAERAVEAALRQDPGQVVALNGAGTLAGLRHDFLGQLRYGRRALRAEPDLASPLTGIFDGQIELGRYEEAGSTAQRLVDLKPTLAAYARVSYYRELTGDPVGAVRAMRFAVSAGGSPQSSAYVRTLLGDLLLVRGRLRAARGAYLDALRDVPSFPQALTGLARLDAARGDLRGAIRRWRALATRLPLPEHVLGLGEAELAAGRRQAARRDLAVIRAERRLLAGAGVDSDAELALYEADHGSPRRAVALARRAWRAAPGLRSADALGWALTRSGRPADGLRWARRALALGSRDPLFRHHAGSAALAAGSEAEGRAHLRTALANGLAGWPWQAAQARRALKGSTR